MRKFILPVLVLLLSLMFIGCQRDNWLLGDQLQRSIVLNIWTIDSTTYSQYYDLVFRTKTGERGGILVNKQDGYLPAHLRPGTGFQPLVLSDVIQFRMDSIGFRGHAVEGGLYVDGERYIDLSDRAKRPYYSLVSDL